MRVGWALGWVAMAGAVAAVMLAAVPLQPLFLDPNLDNSFAAVLNHAAAQPLDSRPRLISTYGPLGFSHMELYLPQTFPRVMALRGLLAAVLAAGIGWLGWAAWRSPWSAAVALAAAAPLLRGGDARLFTLLALVPLVELAVPAPPRALRWALGVALGLAALTKVTFLTATAVVLAPMVAASLLGGRGVPSTAVVAALSGLGAWVLLGLGLDQALDYVRWSATDITPGYSQAMQIRTSPALVLHAAAVALAVWAWVALLARSRRRPGWWAVPLAIAPLLLLQFKAGFVRADVHVFTPAAALLIASVLLALLLGRRVAALGAALVVALPGALLAHALLIEGRPSGSFRVIAPSNFHTRLTTLPAALRGEVFAPQHALRVRELRNELSVLDFEGGVDMFGFAQSLLVAQSAPYRPRPVFQSYMAYTPRLARANAEFLAGDGAPRWILFGTDMIDGRLLAIDDAAAWPELLTRYQPTGTVGSYALLERRAVPRRWRLTPIGSVDALTDKPIAVPPMAAGPVWARVTVDEPLIDRLQTLLLAAPYVSLDIALTNAAVWRARVVAPVARDGFLLSPVVTTPAQFTELALRGVAALPDREVATVSVHVASPFDGADRLRTVRVEFLRLEITD